MDWRSFTIVVAIEEKKMLPKSRELGRIFSRSIDSQLIHQLTPKRLRLICNLWGERTKSSRAGSRLLRTELKAIFQEPLGDSPLTIQ